MASSQVNGRIRGLENAVNSYRRGKLGKEIASLKRQFTLEVSITFGIPIIATILSAIFVNLAAIAAPIVIGAANIAQKLGLSKTIISSYFRDRDALEMRFEALWGAVQLAKIQTKVEDKDKTLNDVEQKLRTYYQV